MEGGKRVNGGVAPLMVSSKSMVQSVSRVHTSGFYSEHLLLTVGN